MFINDIAVVGYQSLYRVGLKLGRFTVIYGESDVGKSALYRAVRALITCESGDNFISDEETKTGVVLRLVSGERIAWIKRKGKSAEYRCGEKIWRRNRAMPSEIAEKLRVKLLSVDNEKFYPNLRGQFDNLFLLFESPAKRARVLGSLISNILLQGIRKANAERNSNEGDIRASEGLIEELDRREHFNWVDFLAQIKSVLKVLNSTLKGVNVHTQTQESLSQWLSLSRLLEFSADFLSQKFFTELEKLVSLHAKVQERLQTYVLVKCRFTACEKTIESEGEKLERLKKEIAKVKKKLTVICPQCGKKISLLELKK